MNIITAAGILCYCEHTGRFLIAKRGSMCPEPGTLCSIGGKSEPEDKTPLDTAIREFNEEAGFYKKFKQIIPGPIYNNLTPNNTAHLIFHNFIGIVNKEFIALYNYENEWIKWMTADELLEVKDQWHFGLTYMIRIINENKQLFNKNQKLNETLKHFI